MAGGIRGAALAGALLGALACGGQRSSTSALCTPSDCAALGAACGAAGDGCGGILECGECPRGQVCGGAGTANVCGASACLPIACPAMPGACGTIPDGCGATVSCGECPPGETCGGGGKANRCGKPPPCQKVTCAAEGASCGTIPDGCGGELACGECRDGDACGAGGTPNVCAPVPPTGEVAWSHVAETPGPDTPVGAGVDADGNRYLLVFTVNETGGAHTLRLEKLTRDGEVVWSREWAAQGFFVWTRPFHLAVTPGGASYLAVSAGCQWWEASPCPRSFDAGGGIVNDSALLKLRPDGRLEWQRELAGTDVGTLSVNDLGSALVSRVRRDGTGITLDRFAADGAPLTAMDAASHLAALDPSGNILVAESGTVRKHSGAGRLAWSASLGGGGVPAGVATTSTGVVVVLAHRIGDVVFGPSQVRSGGLVLFVLEPDGRPRFARGLSAVESPALAVDPRGRVAVVGNAGCGQIAIEAFDLANADLWRRFLPDGPRCASWMPAGPASYGTDHRLFVTGSFAVPVEVGGRTHVPRGQDALGILLDP